MRILVLIYREENSYCVCNYFLKFSAINVEGYE